MKPPTTPMPAHGRAAIPGEPPRPLRDPRFGSDEEKREATEFLASRMRGNLTLEPHTTAERLAADEIERMSAPALVFLEMELRSALAARGHASDYDPFAGVYSW
jgi:hypothetical protein